MFATNNEKRYSHCHYPDEEYWRDTAILPANYLGDVVEHISDDERVWIVNGSPYGKYAYTVWRLNAYGWIADVLYADSITEAYDNARYMENH